MRHFVIVGILIVLVSIALSVGLDKANLLPDPASAQAVPIDGMWRVMEIVMSILFAIIVVPMAYSSVVFRRRKGETGDGEHFEGNINLELAWSSIPLVVVVIFSVLGAQNLAQTIRRDPSAMVIKVTGSQWNWQFEYPADPETGVAVVSNELHLPVGEEVLLRMTSVDVIHSFWVPEFRVKQDVVPGRITELTITPTKEGDKYEVRCAELCGTDHYKMEKSVIVSSREEYEAWLASQLDAALEALKTPEGQGRLLVQNNGCTSCHSLDGAVGKGPTWLNLFGSQVELVGGVTVTADEAFLAQSIQAPASQIVAGFESVQMPNYGFTSDEIAAIVAYIKTIK